MIGWSKLISESSNELLIAYSFEEDKSCDGLLKYDTNDKTITIQQKPRHKEWLENLFICPLRYRIKLGMELGKLYMIMTG